MCGLWCSGPPSERHLMWPFASCGSARVVTAHSAAGTLPGSLVSYGILSFESTGLCVNVPYVSLLEKSFLYFIDWGLLNI